MGKKTMVKKGRLIAGISKAYRLPESKLILSARMIQERGLLTTGAHGVNAPDMKFIDAARMMLGYLVLDKPSLIADAVRVFGAYRSEYRPEREHQKTPRSFQNLRGDIVDVPEDVHIPDLDFLFKLDNHLFEQGFAGVLEQLAEPRNRDFYELVGVKIVVSAHEGRCWIWLPGWDTAWEYSAHQTQLWHMFTGLFPSGVDKFIDDMRPTASRELSLANLANELLSSYPAIHVERSITHDHLIEVAELFAEGHASDG